MHLWQAGRRPWVMCWNMCRHRPLISLTAQVHILQGAGALLKWVASSKTLHGLPSVKESNTSRVAACVAENLCDNMCCGCQAVIGT